MKKILIVHTKYRLKGGEDIAVENEIKFLEKHFDIETLIFSNETKNSLKQIMSLFLSYDKESYEQLNKKISNFDPELIYFHNTWFKGSLSLFKLAKKKKIKVLVKLHNFRYNCTKTFFSSKHLKGEEFCKACGLNKKSVGIFNKYYDQYFFRSLAVVLFGIRYFKILKNSNIKILVLTEFHKSYLIKLNIDEKKIFVFPNYIEEVLLKTSNEKEKFLVYAGRVSREKGVEDLITTFLLSNLEGYSLKIIGDGPLLKSLNEKYNTQNIDFLGNIENKKVLELINKSKGVVTATNLLEGQPTLLCEASMLGVVSIYPEAGGISEFFPKNYDFCFDQFSNNDLSTKLRMIDNKNFSNQGSINKSYLSTYLSSKKLLGTFKKIIDE
tara:strand:- start:6100 stop:7245 length:1146 start_codon:yes stop_codon:yes gene_type:complete